MSKVSQVFFMASLMLHERTERQPKTQMFDKIYKVLMNPNWMKLTLKEPNQNPFSRSDFIHRMNSTDMIWGFLTKFCKLAVMIMFNTHNYTADQWGWGGSRKILQNQAPIMFFFFFYYLFHYCTIINSTVDPITDHNGLFSWILFILRW